MQAKNEEANLAECNVVLVVDDEPLVRGMTADLLEELGYEVVEAADGAQALAMLEERPDVFLLFSDCRMPGMSGPELAKTATERWPHLRVVLATGFHDMRTPNFPTILKPFDYRAMERVVSGVT